MIGDLTSFRNLRQELRFSLKKYGYTLKRVLNNKNRWHTKIVCDILDSDSRNYVSTTYSKQDDYLRLIETTTFLRCNNKLSPKIASLYPGDKTVICKHIGEFLSSYLLANPTKIKSSLEAIVEYLNRINAINRDYKVFVVPAIVRTVLEISNDLIYDFEFLPKVKTVLPKLERSANKFIYGFGIEDPHIWNFRIIRNKNKTQALTTDFDYFSDRVNVFWELGYLYATFRWLNKSSLSLAHEAKNILLSLIPKKSPKAEFMFWLGALSSYCGYEDSMRDLAANGEIAKSELKQQYRTIRWLDEKVASLAESILTEPE
ncbi:MAG: hypothetical protein ISS92_05375 [Candidatus Omnitrophica bacterium]|nr:hypothetical protein [Candidatus Omnitrophota bacterium]